jgi:flavorubredoxin
MMHRIGEDKPVYCSKMGAKNLALHFPQNSTYQPVADGQTLLWAAHPDLLETRMLHWPDSMFTYVAEDQILFPATPSASTMPVSKSSTMCSAMPSCPMPRSTLPTSCCSMRP